MILAFIIMNSLIVYGLFFAEDTRKPAVQVAQNIPLAPPTVTLEVSPSTIPAGTSSALTWHTTGSPTECKASGTWAGVKTMYGSESTGRLPNSGNYKFIISCTNSAGTNEATAVITVGNAIAPAQAVTSKTTASAASGAVYCQGRTPCYGPREVAAHGSSGNCWGWNGDRVININGLDAGYHSTKTGFEIVTANGVCGKDLAPSLAGQVSAGNQTRNHLNSTKSNANANELLYLIGFFDSAKP
jgi:hypothetical protein